MKNEETNRSMEENCGKVKEVFPKDTSLIDLVFTWSLRDVLNQDLLKNQVDKIPVSFQSVEHYLQSYFFPLLEETRAELSSSMETIARAPFAEVISIEECKPYTRLHYNVKVDSWKNKSNGHGKEPYRTLPGDVFIFLDSRPENIHDLTRLGSYWTLGWVNKITNNENSHSGDGYSYKVRASHDIIGVKDGKQKSMFAVFLINITTQDRIWKSLNLYKNMDMIKEILYTNSMVKEICDDCSVYSNAIWAEKLGSRLPSALNESQREAVLSSICKMGCSHKCSVELIWGPPGTGKTKTVSTLLWTLRTNYRILACAPTNVAITELASRVLKLVRESFGIQSRGETGPLICCLSDLLLYGNKDRLKFNSELEDIFLDNRVDRLFECLGLQTGWKDCFNSMISFLEQIISQYQNFLENDFPKRGGRKKKKSSCQEGNPFLGFLRDRFNLTASPLRKCIQTLSTHIPKSYILEDNLEKMVLLSQLLVSFETLLSRNDVDAEELYRLYSHPEAGSSSMDILEFLFVKERCLYVLRILQQSLDQLKLPTTKISIRKHCFKWASMMFCTVSSSFTLHSVLKEPLNLLVIDEAAQMKECEFIIPVQLHGIKHAILIGDEYQLQSMVHSKVANDAGFGRSTFERLTRLGHSRHLLNVQYRMHPSISSFPNSKFYLNQISDGSNVKNRTHRKKYIKGAMFGPYSFINVYGGTEEMDDMGHSRKNMLEVIVVIKIVKKLYDAWLVSKKKVSIGIISPYTAQVVAIQKELNRKYEKLNGFSVKVKSIDGFQGGEEDIIIFSTVRSNNCGSIGFLSNPQRTNVALTRARHCLWIVGNGRTLSSSDHLWAAIVHDARDRQCFFDADEDVDLAKAILEGKKVHERLHDLLNNDIVLYESARWKVLFSDGFRKSFIKLNSDETKMSIMNFLRRLSIGWRPRKLHGNLTCKSSSQSIKQFKVEDMYIVWTIDLVKDSEYIQVLKFWDILPLHDIPMLIKSLDIMLGMYTDDFLNRCKQKFTEGDLEVPMCWPASDEIVQYKDFIETDFDDNSIIYFLGKCYLDHSSVKESLEMKFFSLSYHVMNHLLSGRNKGELDFPYQVLQDERDVILYPKSTFIVGRTGTRKTAVLTMKLYSQEHHHHMMASEGLANVKKSNIFEDITEVRESTIKSKEAILRQIFITVSSKLCAEVQQQISQLKRFARGENFPSESCSVDLHDIDDLSQFTKIPNSFIDVPPESYPLVITFEKFLIMLDGTVGNSYFERFHDAKRLTQAKTRSSRSNALQTFIATKLVNHDRFYSNYWSIFDIQLRKKLDSSTVYSEIISCIKDGKLSRKDYVFLSDKRISTLGSKRRERIYDLFLDYEKRKNDRGEFDMADLVIDLHTRLKKEGYAGEKVDFVYIDEVQDLTAGETLLLKYICKNVKEGFVFSCDTANTISSRNGFRFQDTRNLFYKEFLAELVNDGTERESGQVSDIFHLSHNNHAHASILNLSQSVIDVLFRFYPLSVDILCPEKSNKDPLNNEAPVLIKLGKDKNLITAIFGNSEESGKGIFGKFGADLIILVRDERSKSKVAAHVRRQALVLTITECRGLEFQNVLLYNFFSSSPLKNQWRIVYQYMKEQHLLDSTLPDSLASLKTQTTHDLMPFELKLLYLAITRSTQRLWIYENREYNSSPIFEYWKTLSLVQIKELDDSLLKAMQVECNKEEWSSRGILLYGKGCFDMAAKCFGRAGDAYREKWATAAGLQKAAALVCGSDVKWGSLILREAAHEFDGIGRAESTAQCFIELKEYVRAGAIYMDKYGDSRLEDAGDCFSLARCYALAYEAYARGNYFAKSLSVCVAGKYFEKGLEIFQRWKQFAATNGDHELIEEIEQLEQVFLEKTALYYHELGDNKSMMNFVRAFHFLDSKRNFLKHLSCIDDLLLLEKELGNFPEAIAIAREKGDTLLEIDLLEKAGHFKEASSLILLYVLSSSLWANGNKGWPLKPTKRKEKLLTKAMLLAELESNFFHELVCTEASILTNGSSLYEMSQHFSNSMRDKYLRGQMLSARIMLDAHFRSKTSDYEWEENPMEEIFSRNHVSVETLIYFWTFWKEKVLIIFEYLMNIKAKDVDEYITSCGEFCLTYMGVRTHLRNQNTSFVLLNSDANWMIESEISSLHSSENSVRIDADEFSPAARSYWSTELFSVGRKVLTTLESLLVVSSKNSSLLFDQKRIAINIFEVMEFLTESKFLRSAIDDKTLKEVFDKGSKSIIEWKSRRYESDIIVNSILMKCAFHYHEVQEKKMVMKFVRAFYSMDLKRSFLKKINYLDELLSLEEESGNYMEAVSLVKIKGDFIWEADLLVKAGRSKDASFLILFYVLSNSLWANGNKGWPMNNFKKKKMLLNKAKSLTDSKSDRFFYEFVNAEVEILSNRSKNLSEMNQDLSASQTHKSMTGLIISARKILDFHLISNPSDYEWADGVVTDLIKHLEEKFSKNRASVETLVYYWNLWKENIENIVKYLGCIEAQEGNDFLSHGEFCLNYLGVQNQNSVFRLLNPEADWVKNVDENCLHRNGNLVSIDSHQLVTAARTYWCAELLSVGMQVLKTLKSLYCFSIANSLSAFSQSVTSLHIYEIAKFLSDSKLPRSASVEEVLQDFIQSSMKPIFEIFLPLDWQSVTENMVALRGTNFSSRVLEQVIVENVKSGKAVWTFGKTGKMLMILFGCGNLDLGLCEKIGNKFGMNSPWRTFFYKIMENKGLEFIDDSLIRKLLKALNYTLNKNWRKEVDHISPNCFLYLVERLLIWVSHFHEDFFTTRFCLMEITISQGWNWITSSKNTSGTSIQGFLEKTHDFILHFVERLLVNKSDTIEWMVKSNIDAKEFYPLLVLRLVVLMCLLCMNSGKHFGVLYNTLGRSEVGSLLPLPFYSTIKKGQNNKSEFVIVLAKALMEIGDPLVMVDCGNSLQKFQCSDAIQIRKKEIQSSEDILGILFSNSAKDFKNPILTLEKAGGGDNERNSCSELWKMFDGLAVMQDRKDGKGASNVDKKVGKLKVKFEEIIDAVNSNRSSCNGKDKVSSGKAKSLVNEFKLLSLSLNMSDQERENNMLTIKELFRKLKLYIGEKPFRMPKTEKLVEVETKPKWKWKN